MRKFHATKERGLTVRVYVSRYMCVTPLVRGRNGSRSNDALMRDQVGAGGWSPHLVTLLGPAALGRAVADRHSGHESCLVCVFDGGLINYVD